VFLHDKWHQRLFIAENIVTERAELYADAVADKLGVEVSHCVGFIDGTYGSVCRPSVLQQNLYSGYKKGHFLKWQAVTTPDGIIISLFGPVAGRLNDVTLLTQSNLPDIFPPLIPHGHYLHADGIYPPCFSWIKFSSRGRHGYDATVANVMSSVRISVEHSFHIVSSSFANNQWKHQLKLLTVPALVYAVSVLFQFVSPLSCEDLDRFVQSVVSL